MNAGQPVDSRAERAPPSNRLARLGLIFEVLGTALVLGVLGYARLVGLFFNALFVFVLLGASATVVSKAIALVRRRVDWLVYRRLEDHVPQLLAAALRVLAYVACGMAVHHAVVPIQFSTDELSAIRLMLWALVGLLLLCALLPRQRRYAPSDFIFLPLLLVVSWDLVVMSREPAIEGAVILASPFERPAYVFQGGQTPLLNHHACLSQQSHALDLVLTAEGGLHRGNPSELEAYPCFGALVLSPVDGRVAHVVRGRPDMPIGQVDREVITGNSVSVSTEGGRYVLLAHLQADSVSVEEGEQVVRGQPLARCGNSGNTSFPHLHLQAQSEPEFSPSSSSLRTFPIVFLYAERVRRGVVSPSPFAVVRNDVIRPL